MPKFQIDNMDKKILSLLMKNARIPFLEVARECGVSGAAIHQRVQRLTDAGVITGSHFTVDPKRLGYETCAFLGIFLEKASMYNSVIARLETIPEIVESHYTTGQYAIFVKIFAHNNEHLKSLLNDKLQSIEGISSTETFISLEESIGRQLSMD